MGLLSNLGSGWIRLGPLCRQYTQQWQLEIGIRQGQPDSVGNDIWGESVAFIRIHAPILPKPAF